MSEVTFARLGRDGKIESFQTVKHDDIKKCPHLLLLPTHYRQDGSCRCFDPTASEQMEGLGYVWDDGQWVPGA